MSRAPSAYYYQDGPVNTKGMFSEDEDSRDSGIGDVDFGPASLKGAYCGEQLFILDEEMEDLTIDENSCQTLAVKKFQKVRIFGDITNSQKNEASPVSRKSSFLRTKSSMVVRKRTLPNIDYQSKRQKDQDLADNEHIEPETKPRRRSLLRAFSTSTLEVHQSPSACDELPQPLVVNYSLPVISCSDSVVFKRIEATTLSDLMITLSPQDFFDRYILVDCRYPYEYDGGHIQNAINLFDPNECEKFFFGEELTQRKIPIFYCEYSQKRGPGMAAALRGADRIRNVDQYPFVTYKEMYVLDKGYKGFFEALSMIGNQSLCSPCNYVTMDDPQYTHLLRTFAFHKRYATAATCVKSEKSKASRIQAFARQTSHESPVGRRPTRRPLFVTTTASPEPQLEPQRLTYSPDTIQS